MINSALGILSGSIVAWTTNKITPISNNRSDRYNKLKFDPLADESPDSQLDDIEWINFPLGFVDNQIQNVLSRVELLASDVIELLRLQLAADE